MSTIGIFSTAYLPPIAWFQHIANCEIAYVETQENYIKQSYRNRCQILSANGILNLSVPVLHVSGKQKITEVQTQELEGWRKIHWQAICSAYGKSAFFMYYRDIFEPIFLPQSSVSLLELNQELIRLILKALSLKVEIHVTDKYESDLQEKMDYRNYFNAKNTNRETELIFAKKYFQVFAEKFPFEPNLSILDLLFNVGPRSQDYLLLKTI
ncbi:MAG: WbqC family protein [Bacteroidia bacterium]|nr:WbqC family protein [Bacteroidia bacterium]